MNGKWIFLRLVQSSAISTISAVYETVALYENKSRLFFALTRLFLSLTMFVSFTMILMVVQIGFTTFIPDSLEIPLVVKTGPLQTFCLVKVYQVQTEL